MTTQALGTALILTLGLAACQQSGKVNQRQGPQGQTVTILNQGVNLQIQGHQLDAYDYTFGSQALQIKKIEEKGSNALDSTRQVFVASPASLGDDIKAGLSSLCQDIGLSTSAQEFTEATSLPANGLVYAHWRSHYSLTQKRQLSAALEQVKGAVRCLLKIQVGDAAAQQYAIIAFDPVPVENQNVAGTDKILEAVEEGVMLIDKTPALAMDQGQLLTVESPADIKPKITALNSVDVKSQLSNSTGAPCRLHTLNGQTKVGNPTALRSYQYSLSSAKAYTLGSVSAQSISGRNLQACTKVKTQVVDKSVQADVACGDYRSIQEEGLEAGCQWSVEVVNPNDVGNALGYNISMEKMTFETIDVSTPGGAAVAIPEAPNNPVRAKSTTFTGFNAAQLSSMEQAFDFWIAVSPASFAAHWDKYITNVNYLARTGAACSEAGVLAYVEQLNSTEMFWCEAAGMSAAAVSSQNSPLAMLLIGVTAFHENLHNRGREHDFDAPQYQPCKGTSESALLSFDAIKTCTADYCLAFKDFALQEYIAELDYSLEADARRFQGLCQTWNAGLGLTAANFGT
ncbi:hypothetical protein [Oligoflexus tunisiensis]|uniref:hypothetical protein n=1 Tax=Oligoflexus tunisiensis TaxID=708132 RepID=UPI00114CAABB|nr:hypothetical protein [Oligoflexus tunisiensis]